MSQLYPRNLQEQSSGVESQPQSQVAWQHEIAGLLVTYVKTAGGGVERGTQIPCDLSPWQQHVALRSPVSWAWQESNPPSDPVISFPKSLLLPKQYTTAIW